MAPRDFKGGRHSKSNLSKALKIGSTSAIVAKRGAFLGSNSLSEVILENNEEACLNPKDTRVSLCDMEMNGPILNEHKGNETQSDHVAMGLSSPSCGLERMEMPPMEQLNGEIAKEMAHEGRAARVETMERSSSPSLSSPSASSGGPNAPINAGKSSWASIVTGNSSTSMKLSYIQPPLPSSDGVVTIKPPASIALKGKIQWDATLVGFFLDKLPYSFVHNVANRLWSSKGLTEVLANNNGFYFFRFSCVEAMAGVVDGGPWYFGGKPIFLQ